jgi:dTDP-4-dehydrorhamnose reductase
MKVLILGSMGQVGSEIEDSLKLKFSTSKVNIIKLTRKDLDLMHFEELKAAVYDLAPNVLINAAAYTNVDSAEKENIYANKLNGALPSHLGLICSELNIILIHFSTDYVFNGSLDRPYNESDVVEPLGTYGMSKLDGEEGIRKYCDRHIILRTAWVFGNNGNNFVKKMIEIGKNKTDIRVISDQIGSPTSAKSIAKTVSEILFKMKDADKNDKRWGTYHYSGVPYLSWAEFAEEIFIQAFNKGLLVNMVTVHRINSSEFPTTTKRPKNSRLDCNKIELNFGVSPDNWKKSLEMLINSWSIKDV